MNEIQIPCIVGSLRKDSCNHFALKAAQELVPDGAVLNLIELHQKLLGALVQLAKTTR